MAKEVGMEFAFFEFLRSFYVDNRGIIRNRYREITKKYLDYNDKEKNPDAFLRTPQFEALEMYVFVKEFMNNQQMYQMFDDWSKASPQTWVLAMKNPRILRGLRRFYRNDQDH